MSATAKSGSARCRLRSWWVWASFAGVGALTLFCLWFSGFSLGEADPLFRGKPESEWIKNLKYWDDEQVKEWRTFGAEGLPVLVRGLNRSIHPGERAYRQIYRRLPGFLAHRLPGPKRDSTRSSRMCIVALLVGLDKDADAAMPMMIWLLNHDEDESVREIVISYFTSSEDEKCRLNQMLPKEKLRVLSVLTRDLKNRQNWGLRNNAANALRWFPEHRAIVAPVLTNAIHDPQPQVALLAVAALHRVAPDWITNVSAVSIVAQILQNPDDQIAYRAAELLGELKVEPDIAVPALIGGLHSTNRLVTSHSLRALFRFDQPMDLIFPALEGALHSTNLPPSVKKDVQRRIDSLTAIRTMTN